MRFSQVFSKYVFAASTLTLLSAMTVACGQAKWHETDHKNLVAPFTGDPVAERQTTPTRATDLHPGQGATVNPNRLCGRRIPNGKPCTDKDLPLEKGDKVVVDDPKPKDGLVKCHVTDSNRKDVPDSPVYVPPQYLNPDVQGPAIDGLASDKYYVIENVATEKLRLYERVSSCENRLILETDMVVGLDAPGRRTKVGSFTLTQWNKFLEDSETAAWYSPEYPQLPAPGADLMSWTSKSLLPRHAKHSVRGSYGWFTAQLEPNADDQGLQGTVGWGSDGDKFIDDLRRSPLDHNPRLASHGATRVENRAIAMLREILAAGTRVVRVYAKEGLRSPMADRSKVGHWDYILTTENGEGAPRAGRRSVIQRAIPQDLYLESGRYKFKASATPVALTDGENPHRNGNVYHVPLKELKGVFFVDEGRLTDDYRAPKSLEAGGHEDGYLPSVVYASRRCEAPAPQPRPTAQPEPAPELPPILPEQPQPEPPAAPERPSHHMD